MKRALKGLGWGLLALLLAIALMLGWVVGTESGSRWALGRVPGLTLTGFEGRLGGHWQAERLVWQQDARRIEIEQPEMDWSPACLLRLTLCIESLTAGAVELVFPPTPEQQPPAEPFSLADIKLPLELRVGELAVGPVRFNGTEQLQRLRLVADWGEEGATLETLRLVRDDVELTLEGRLSTTGQWPLELQGTATLTAPEDQPWELDFAASGELRDQVALRVDSDGYFEGRLSGEVQPLAEHLPARLRLEGDDFKPLPTLPETLRLQDIELTLAGNLEQGYQVLGTTRLPAEGTPVDVALQLTPQGFARLVAAISVSHELDAAGQPIPLGPGLYGMSRFYASREAFHLFATCNVWVAAMLHEAGVPVSPTLSPTSGALLAKLRRHGQAVRPAP